MQLQHVMKWIGVVLCVAFLLGAIALHGPLGPVSVQAQGETQTSGPPLGVIIKAPGESDLQVGIKVGRLFYGAGESVEAGTAAEPGFISLGLNKQAAVYLLLIKGNGEVVLLFPNKSVQGNFLLPGNYTFPGPGLLDPPFEIPGPVDRTAYVQVIAVPMSIKLEPESFSEDFPRLGGDPQSVKSFILRLIASALLRPADWAASWTQYEVVGTIPFTTPSPGQLAVEVREGECTNPPTCSSLVPRQPLSGAEVIVDEQTRGLTDTAGKFSQFPVAAGPHSLRVRRGGYQETGQETVTVPIGGSVSRSYLLVQSERSAKVIVNRDRAILPDSEIEFDASGSKGDPVIFEWDFESDGSIDQRTPKQNPKVRHTFLEAGSHKTTLYAVYDDADIRSDNATIAIEGPSIPRPGLPGSLSEPGSVLLEGQGSINPITMQLISGKLVFVAMNTAYPAPKQYGEIRLQKTGQGWPPARLSFTYNFLETPTRQNVISLVRVIPLAFKDGKWVCLDLSGRLDTADSESPSDLDNEPCSGMSFQATLKDPGMETPIQTSPFQLPEAAIQVVVTVELAVSGNATGKPVKVQFKDHQDFILEGK